MQQDLSVIKHLSCPYCSAPLYPIRNGLRCFCCDHEIDIDDVERE